MQSKGKTAATSLLIIAWPPKKIAIRRPLHGLATSGHTFRASAHRIVRRLARDPDGSEFDGGKAPLL
jgi:hypothetical protein